MSFTCLEVANAVGFTPGKRLGSDYLFRCPNHDDDDPSLSINPTKDVFLCGPCGASGTAWQLAAFLARVDAGDKPAVYRWLQEHGLLNGNDRATAAQTFNEKQVVKTYPYVDEDNQLLFEVVRLEPKDFRQRRPDGNGGYVWNLECVRRVPYRLPQILTAEEIFWVEGEKDVESLEAIGLTATTSPMGAAGFRPEYAEHFSSTQRVTLIPDNDQSGRQYANAVAATLFAKVASVKILELPGLPEKGDVSDWLEGKDTETAAEELCSLAERAQQWKPETTNDVVLHPGMRFIGMRELLNEPEEKTRWLVDELLPAAGDSLCVAKPKVGKSTLARCLALAVARGEDFLGRKTTQGTVFYLALEEKKSEVRRHFVAMGAKDDDPILLFCATSPVDGLDRLRESIQQHKPVLVIVDPLFRFVRFKDGNDYAAVTNALEPLHALARESGAHVMANHHAGKGERDAGDSVLGSTALFAAVDTLLVMKRSDKYRTVSSVQRYGTDLEEIILQYNEQTGTLTAGLTRADADVSQTMKAIVEFLETQSEPVEFSLIDDAIEGRKQTKLQALKQIQSSGTAFRSGNGKKGDPYLFSIFSSAVPLVIGRNRELNPITDTKQKGEFGSRVPVYTREPQISGNDKPGEEEI